MPPPSGTDELPPLSADPESVKPLDTTEDMAPGMQTLKKIRINDTNMMTDEARIRALLPRVPAPSGTLTGTTQPPAGQPGMPPVPVAGQPAPPPQQAAPTPAVVQQQPVVVQQPVAQQPTPIIAATPGVIQPPPTETRH
jgi:hypothetical protein